MSDYEWYNTEPKGVSSVSSQNVMCVCVTHTSHKVPCPTKQGSSASTVPPDVHMYKPGEHQTQVFHLSLQ
jgi:hypothetical protein